MPWSRGPRQKPSSQGPEFLLDQFSPQDVNRWKKLRDQILRYQWDYYNSLAYQRSRIADAIRSALLEAAEKPFRFSKWQRIARYRFALQPLSLHGSLADPGGRFNVGEINPTQFPPFPALYLAADKNTALQEVLSQTIGSNKRLGALDFALAKPDSIVVVSISGSFSSIINLKRPAGLEVFLDLIKGFSVPRHLIDQAKAIGLPPPVLVRDKTNLIEALLGPEWRRWPMQYDVPAPSQIFGQLVAEAGIEAILYPSKFGGNDCLAVFPQNFDDTDAFLQLDDDSPQQVSLRRIDASNWREALRDAPRSP